MSNENPAYYDEELTESCKDLSRKILKLNKGQFDGKQKQSFTDEIDEDLKHVQKMYKAMARSIRKLEGADSVGWKKKLTEHKMEIAKLLQNLQTAKEKSSRDELLSSVDEGSTTRITDKKEMAKSKRKETIECDINIVEVRMSEKSKSEQLAEELFKEIYETQGESLDIVKRLVDKAYETELIAAESMVILKQQREKLENIDKELDELGSNVTRGANELNSFMRRLATDKIILILLLFVVLVVFGVIVWRIVDYCVNKFAPKQNNSIPPQTITKENNM